MRLLLSDRKDDKGAPRLRFLPEPFLRSPPSPSELARHPASINTVSANKLQTRPAAVFILLQLSSAILAVCDRQRPRLAHQNNKRSQQKHHTSKTFFFLQFSFCLCVISFYDCCCSSFGRKNCLYRASLFFSPSCWFLRLSATCNYFPQKVKDVQLF